MCEAAGSRTTPQVARQKENNQKVGKKNSRKNDQENIPENQRESNEKNCEKEILGKPLSRLTGSRHQFAILSLSSYLSGPRKRHTLHGLSHHRAQRRLPYVFSAERQRLDTDV